jgi:hypothetical protein
MPHGKYAKCPCCGKSALGEDKIMELFGFRFKPNGKRIPQSYCRECRSEQIRERNKIKREQGIEKNIDISSLEHCNYEHFNCESFDGKWNNSVVITLNFEYNGDNLTIINFPVKETFETYLKAFVHLLENKERYNNKLDASKWLKEGNND